MLQRRIMAHAATLLMAPMRLLKITLAVRLSSSLSQHAGVSVAPAALMPLHKHLHSGRRPARHQTHPESEAVREGHSMDHNMHLFTARNMYCMYTVMPASIIG